MHKDHPHQHRKARNLEAEEYVQDALPNSAPIGSEDQDDSAKGGSAPQTVGEASIRRAVESSTDCIKVLDLDGNLEYMNEGGMCVMEIEDFEQFRGRCWPDFWQGEEGAKANAALDAARSGNVGRFQGYTATAKGNVRYWDVTVSPVPGPDGSPEKLLSVSRDITIQKQAEVQREQLLAGLESERRKLWDLFEQAPAAVAVFEGDDLVYAFTSARYRNLFTRDRDVVGQRLVEVLPDAVEQGFDGILRTVMATGVPFRHPETAFTIQATETEPTRTIYVDFIYQPIWGTDGTASGVFAHIIDVTDQVQAREAIVRSEENRRLALESAGIGAWNLSLPSFQLSGDARFFALFGLSGARLEFKDAFDIIHPDDRESVRERVKAALRPVDPMPYAMEYRVVHPNGSVRWLSTSGQLNSRSDGSGGFSTSLDGTIIDITDQKAVEETLRENEAHQRAVLDSSAGGFYSVDAEGVTTLCNAAFLEMLGFEGQDEVIGRKLHDVIHHSHPDGSHYPVEECPIYRAASLGIAAHVSDEVFFRLDGTSFPVEYWSSPITIDGETRGAVTTFVDVTERRMAEAALRKSEERFRAAQETTPDPFTILEAVRDPAGEVVDFRWTFVNEATGRLTGETAEDLLGSLVSELRPGIRETDLYRGWLETLETGQPFSREVFMNFPSGRTFLRLTGVKVGDGIGTSFTDLTQRQLNEEKLELVVSERTAQLQAAVKEAEGFNYSISHDLRAPLRAISMTSSILLEEASEALSAEHRELLVRQSHNANRLGRLIDELLRLSRLSRAEVSRQRLNLTAMAHATFGDLVDLGGTNGCRFEVQEGMEGQGDAGLVRTVLQNLVGNACKFSPGGGTIRMRQDGSVFSVSDEGVGFDMKYAPKVFLPFERLVGETEFEGTGIGLANVKRIVERHGGGIWCESEPGHGSKFSFTLG